jgi:hypothetical protein
MRRVLALSFVLAGIAASAQTPGRIATTPESLLASPGFFHGKQVALRATVTEERGVSRLDVASGGGEKPMARTAFVLWKDRVASADEGEIRGEFLDLGRVSASDSKLSNYDLRPILEVTTNGSWPVRDTVYVILGAVRTDAPPDIAPTVRAIVMDPTRYASRTVTVSGRFRGRNLFGDVPSPLNRSKWDFVIQSTDAGLWVSNLRPRGKGFEFDPGLRADTGRWVEVSGTVQTEGSRVWIEGATIQLATPPTDAPVEVTVPIVKEPPAEVIFSAPVAEEADVALTSTVRVQFSRALDGRTLRDRIRVSYLPPPQGEPPPPPVFAFTYNEGLNALQIKFAKPLERFQRVKVELLEGVTSADGQPLAPWTLTFSTGN